MKSGDLLFLSKEFFHDYPYSRYPEIALKQNRPYIYCIVSIDGFPSFAIPFRSHIKHKHCFRTVGDKGLDFSKAIPIVNEKYIDGDSRVYIDQGEFSIVKRNMHMIKRGMERYLRDYIKAKKNLNIDYNRSLVEKSTLQYFEDYISVS